MLNVTSQCSGEVVSAHRDEVSSEPRLVLHSIVHACLSAMKVHLGVVNVRVLGGGVVPPDDDVLHFVRGDTATYRHLQNRAGCSRQCNLSSVLLTRAEHQLFPAVMKFFKFPFLKLKLTI